jgi:tetratricopeptide (TPR) repeat protein
MIDYAKKSGVENHPSSLIDYRFIRKMHDFHTGCLEEDRDLDDIFRTALHMGDFWPATIYCVYSGMISTELGQYQRVSDLIHKLEEISESFDNSHARAQSYRLSAWANYKFRRIDQTLAVAEEGIRTTGKTGHFAMLLVIWCAKSLAHSARHETDMADKAFAEATKLVAERKIMTVYHMPYLEARAEIAISALEMALANHDNVMEKAREALRAANDMLKSSKKMKSAEITAYLIKARVCCLLGKRKKAYGYFVRSIRSGIRYNAALELARAYFETGKCLLATGSGRSSLMGVSGNEYLLKARTLFNEMDLQWDLQRYSDYMER